MGTAQENMKARIQYSGGKSQVDRMNVAKVQSLKKALLYSYQSATAILSDGREFRCLINPDKIKRDYDNKLISIPFKDICLNPEVKQEKTSMGEEEIGMKAGDVFTWKENNTDWIVFLQRLEETAYFRAEIRRCKYTITLGEQQYKVYASGPTEETIDWKKASGINWNNLNYSLIMYVTKDETTEEYFHRFATVELNGKPWEVQAADSMSIDGVIIVALQETYQNSIEKELNNEKVEDNVTEPDIDMGEEDEEEIYIDGDTIVYPYDEKTYYIEGTGGGTWSIDNTKKVQIMVQDSAAVQIAIMTGRSGNFNLIYSREGQEDIVLPITIESL